MTTSRNFAITGVAGYVAPRHLKAISETGNRLVAAIDPHDAVGILDRYSFQVRFFTEIERFDRHLEKLREAAPDRGEAGGIGGIGVTVASQNFVEPKPVSSLTLTERTGCPVDCGATDFRR